MANRQPFPDFFDDIEFNSWFQRYAWTGSPDKWDLDTVERVQAEAFKMRRELDRRMMAVGDSRTDKTLFWSGFTISVAGAALLFFPPAAIPVLITTSLTISGLGISVFGVARTQAMNETKNQVLERSRDLNNFEQAMLTRKKELS